MFSSSKSSTRSPLPPERAAPSDTNAEVLASIAGSVILRLRAIRLIADVFQADRAAAPIYQMVKWEHANAPLRLPADLRAFYYDHTDGVDVQWRVRPGASIEQILVDPTAAHSYPIGQLHLNSIAQLTPLPPTAILDAQARLSSAGVAASVAAGSHSVRFCASGSLGAPPRHPGHQLPFPRRVASTPPSSPPTSLLKSARASASQPSTSTSPASTGACVSCITCMRGMLSPAAGRRRTPPRRRPPLHHPSRHRRCASASGVVPGWIG